MTAKRDGASLDIECRCAVCQTGVESITTYWATHMHKNGTKVCELVVWVKCHGKSAELRIPESQVDLIAGPGLAFMDEKVKIDKAKITAKEDLSCVQTIAAIREAAEKKKQLSQTSLVLTPTLLTEDEDSPSTHPVG